MNGWMPCTACTNRKSGVVAEGSVIIDKNSAECAMTAIALIVQPGATPSSVMVTLDIFAIANRFVEGDHRFRIDLLSIEGGMVGLAETVRVETQALPRSFSIYDAVILPGFFAEDAGSLVAQLQSVWKPVIACLRRVGNRPLVAASCYGTFVLAESGLLDRRIATTTWWMQHEFGTRYPAVRLDADQTLAIDGRFITAGAMTAHIDLSMAVLRHLAGVEVARHVGSIMLVNDARTSQRPFMVLQQSFSDPLVQQAADWMAEHLAQDFSAQELAKTCHVSYRTLHRRFSQAAGQSPLEYMQALRVKHAKGLLENGRMSLEQIIARIGYDDASSFRRLFTREVGLSPAQYRRQFRHAG